jgi:preprotein translocase subunit SecD
MDIEQIRSHLLEDLRENIRRLFREARIGYTGGITARAGGVEVQLSEPGDLDRALGVLAETAMQGSSAPPIATVARAGERLIRITPTDATVEDHWRAALRMAVDNGSIRISASSTGEAAVWQRGDGSLLALVPGARSTAAELLRQLIPVDGKLTMRLADAVTSRADPLAGGLSADAELLHASNGTAFVVEKQFAAISEDIFDTRVTFDQDIHQPIVVLRFNVTGARRLSQATRENVGRRLALILNGELLAAPVIREPIAGGAARLSGSYSIEEAERLVEIVCHLAILPALHIVEERVIDPYSANAEKVIP